MDAPDAKLAGSRTAAGRRVADIGHVGGVRGGGHRLADPAGISLARRALDLLVSGSALLLLSPLLAAIAVAIRLADGAPVLFRQTRVGAGGAPFTFFKFRSMRPGVSGPQVTSPADLRSTTVGRFLRRTSLDELPQLWNILRGDMTLVGPRPEPVALAERYPESCQWVFAHRPGLTGPTQIWLRAAELAHPDDPERYYLQVLVPARVACDRTYLQHPSLLATLLLLWQTARYLAGVPSPPPGPIAGSVRLLNPAESDPA